jgi:subtilisin family serine protease
MLLLSYCGTKPAKEEDTDERTIENMYQEIPNQYVVVLKSKSVQTEGKRKHKDRKSQRKLNESRRISVRQRIDSLIARNNLTVNGNDIMTDIVAGFRIRMNAQQARDLQKNEGNNVHIINDFTVKLRNPIQQSEPIASRNPIQQDYDIIDEQNGLTCAVNQTGGPTDGSGKSTFVWVLDTGVQLDHPDLNVVTDSELAVSVIPGDTNPNDFNGHGTHVAGIIGALNNDIGSVGVSAGAKIVPVKVLENSGSGSWSYILRGLEHVAMYNSRGDVVNMSLGAFDPAACNQANNVAYQILNSALTALAEDTTYIVIASGNEGKNARNSLPACMDTDDSNNIFVVGATDCIGKKCEDYSNFGQPPVYWLAVGSNVFSTYKDSNYKLMSGTSMATAIVSGVIHSNEGPPVSVSSVDCRGRTNGMARVR